MGEKLDKPITEKTPYDEENEIIIFGINEMQAYKKYKEVFTLKNTKILEQNQNIFLFGIFDGHNGAEIAKYLSIHFSQFLSENNNFINGDYKKALKETFINIDYSFRAQEVQLELSKYSIKKSPNFQDLNLDEEENKNIANFLDIFDPRNLESANIANFCGSCGIVILITEKSVFIANIGNSKCIPINTKNEIIKDKINKQHIISDEIEIKRLKMAYGFIEDDNDDDEDFMNFQEEKKEFNPRDFYPLIITRGFGDLQYKDNKFINIEDQYISVNPEIIEIPIEELNYLIIGNYGVFGENDQNKLTINQTTANYFLNKFNNKENENQKISDIIGNFFDEIIEEKQKETNIVDDNEDIIENNMACIIIKFKNENNNVIIEGDKEKEKENEKDSEKDNEKENEKDNENKIKEDEKEEDKKEDKNLIENEKKTELNIENKAEEENK